MATIDLTALLAEAEAEEKAAGAVELSEEEKAAHLLLERRAKAREARAALGKARREVEGGLREAAARTAAGGWIVVELNDGQRSGLSENDPRELYAAMARGLDGGV